MLRIKFIFLFFIISSLYVNGFAQSNDTSFNSNSGKFELKLKYIFGNESLAEENLLFNPNGIFQDKENNYYILDGGNYRIVKYDAAHQYILQMGNKGQGPADLARPSAIFGDNDYIYVIDGGNFKIIKLNKNLELISTVKIDPFPNNLFFKNNFYYSSGLNARIKADSDLSLIIKYSEEFEKVIEIGKFVDYEGKFKNGLLNQFDLIANNKNELIVSYKHKNEIVKYSGNGEKLFTKKRVLKYEIEDVNTDNYQSISIYKIPIYNIISKGVAVDKDDNIWILTPSKKEEKKTTLEIRSTEAPRVEIGNDEIETITNTYYLDILDSNGIKIDEISINFNANRIYIFNDTLYLIDQDNLMVIYEYEIVIKS